MKGLSSLFLLQKTTNNIWQSLITDNCIQWIGWRLRTPTVLSLCTVSALYDERNGIQLTSRKRLKLWKRMVHPSLTFCAERKAYQLLWSNSQGVRVRYSIHSIRVRIWLIPPIALLRLIRLGIWHEHGVVFKTLITNWALISQVE